MRYTLAAFAMMASAAIAVPMALDTGAGHVVARGTANTNAVNWKEYGASSYDDWKHKGGWKDYDTWKKYAEENCPWKDEGFASWDDWWSKDGYAWWRKISGDTNNKWDRGSDFDSWFKNDGYKIIPPWKSEVSDWFQDKYGIGWHKENGRWVKDKEDNNDWFQDEYGVGWHKKNGKWAQDEDDFSSWGKIDPKWKEYFDGESSGWGHEDDDNEWFKDEYGQGWHKVKWSGKWEKDSSDDSGAWKKGSDGKWSKGSVSEYKYPDEWKN